MPSGAGRKNSLRSALLLLLGLSACDSRSQSDGELSNGSTATKASASLVPAAEGWGAKLLSLVPERGDQSTPSLDSVRAIFKDCGLSATNVARGRCDLMARAPVSPSDPSVDVEIVSAGGEARAVRLTACCSADKAFFRPIAAETVIRTELICPELTIVSSESVQAYRVASSGKRDFVYATADRSTVRGRLIELTMLLSSVEPSDECAALAGAQSRRQVAGE